MEIPLPTTSPGDATPGVAEEHSDSPGTQHGRGSGGNSWLLGRSIAVSLLFTGGVLGLGLISSVVVARLGGADARGLYSLAQATIVLSFTVLSLGLNHSTIYFLGAGEPPDQVVGLNHLAVGLVGSLGFVIAGTIYVVHGGFPESPMALVILSVGIGLLPGTYLEYGRAFFLGIKRVAAFNLCQISTIIVFILLNLLTLREHRNWVLVNLVLSLAIVSAMIAVAQFRAVPRMAWPRRDFRRASIGYGLKASLVSVADILLLRIDTILLAKMISLPSLGIYAIADQLSSALAMGPTVIGRMMFAQSSHDPGGEESRRKLGLLVRLLVPTVIAVTAVSLATFWWLIPLIFGDEFRDSYGGFVLFAPSILFRALHIQFSTYLTGQGIQKPVIIAGWTGVGADVGLLLALVPVLGWHGAAIAKMCGFILQFVVAYVAYRGHEPADQRLRWVLDRQDIQFIVRWVQALRRGQSAADEPTTGS